jgi:hypothetical protein
MSSDATPGYPAPETACMVATKTRRTPNIWWIAASGSDTVIAEQLPFAMIAPLQPRCLR